MVLHCRALIFINENQAGGSIRKGYSVISRCLAVAACSYFHAGQGEVALTFFGKYLGPGMHIENQRNKKLVSLKMRY
ncbi:MAG TPA: hypothetical protein DF409_01710 [Bacteroidales bacterium]|nr:hypothetical protein [Bacteroidales bacterium]